MSQTLETVLVSNLDPNISQDEIKEIFQDASIQSVTLFHDCNGISKGIAELTCTNNKEANRLVTEYHEVLLIVCGFFFVFHIVQQAEVDGRPMYLELVRSKHKLVVTKPKLLSSFSDWSQLREPLPTQRKTFQRRKPKISKEHLDLELEQYRNNQTDFLSYGQPPQ